MDVKLKLFHDHCIPEQMDQGDWIDLKCAKDMTVSKDNFYMIPLGVAMEIPEGYEAVIVPRSSTYKNYRLIQANSFGVVDNSYKGPNDEWHFPAYCTGGFTRIRAGERICQFRLQKNQNKIKFKLSDLEHNADRGGFGSTGK